jgi:hypothetical protein
MEQRFNIQPIGHEYYEGELWRKKKLVEIDRNFLDFPEQFTKCKLMLSFACTSCPPLDLKASLKGACGARTCYQELRA